MPLELQNTTLGQAPFFDDYNIIDESGLTPEDKNYHRVLFRPSVAVQARELTQLQTILQGQIERFGENIYKTGTIIKGVTQSFDDNYQYIKINDNQIDGQPVDVVSYNNGLVINESTGLQAVVVNYATGLESQNPDLSTLYIKYLNTGSSGEKQFGTTNILTIYDRQRTVESITVEAGGTNYQNTDTVVFTSSVGGTGAVGQIITWANGTIREVVVTQGGNGYTEAPTITITTGGGGTGAVLTAKHFIAQVQVANNNFSSPIGTGYAVTVTDGIIFQKGHFIRVPPQTTIASKYSSSPNNAVVGFYTEERIVNSTIDTTLLDNASGSPNESAPGAYRLQLTPRLLTKTKEDAQSNTAFFSVIEFQNGKKVRQSEETEFNSIGRELARRTYDESGNYVVTPFPVYTQSIAGNTTHLNVAVGAGVGYIEGYRVKNADNVLTPIRKATDTQVDISQTISTNYGSYIEVRELYGIFDHTTCPTIALRDTAAVNVTKVSQGLGGTPVTPGSTIGTAKLRNVVFQSGVPGAADAIYRLYIFGVKMEPGRSFSEIRSVTINGVAAADPVLDVDSRAILRETDYDTLVFKSGTGAVKQLTGEEFIYRGVQTRSFSTAGVATVPLVAPEKYPYSVSLILNDTQEADFVIIPTQTRYATVAKTGLLQTFGNTTIRAASGSSTQFFSDYNVGEFVVLGASPATATPYRIVRILTNTTMEVAGSPPADTNLAHYLAFPANVPVSTFRRTGAGISIDSSGSQATINLGSAIGALNGVMSAVIFYNAKVSPPLIGTNLQKPKRINKDRFVKIPSSVISTNPNGPWCLGIGDVTKIVAVYQGTGTSYNTLTDISNYFLLDSGQRDNYYGLAYLRKNPGNSVNLQSNANLLVKMDYYEHDISGYYFSAESYPVDDDTPVLPSNKIRTEEINIFKSPSSGKVFDLRDCIDFRPKVADIVTPNVNPNSAPTVTSSTETFTGVFYFPTPNEAFRSSVESYLPRIDRVSMDSLGNVRVTEGVPSNNPSAPTELAGAMTLGLINVPPYPTLSPADAAAVSRPDLATKVSVMQQRRYTMKDVSDIDRRISRLEYYSLLNSLEQDTKNLIIPSEINASVDRFKNGFFVDPFNNYDVANVNDNEYTMFIDIGNSVARSRIKQYKVDVTFDEAGSSGVVRKGDQVMLNYTDTPFIEQPFATRFRNCVENQYHYKGTMFLFPEYDNFYDTSVSPAQVTIDIAGALDPLVAAVNASFERIGGRVNITESVSSEALLATNRTRVDGGTNVENIFQETTVNTGTETRWFVNPGTSKESRQVVGDFVTNMTMQPYIRPQAVKFVATGLRPKARHYIFFDKKDVTDLVQPGNITTESPNIAERNIFTTGGIGDVIFADDRGIVAGIFYIPASSFFCGERELVVMDSPSFDSETAATSKSIGTFNAYNFSVEKKELSFNTKAYTDINLTQSTTPYTSTTRTNFSRQTFVADPPADPIAQSFKVEAPDPSLDGIVVTKIDLYFKRKDPVLGLNVEIREVLLGTPTPTRIPFAHVRVPAADVNVSDDATAVTTITFPTPVFLKSNKEYAFVVYPDAASPEYLIFTGEAGSADLANPTFVKKNDWGLGALFLSTNGSTWQSFQFEDIKFKLYRAEYTSLSGTVSTIPDGYEFLTIDPKEGGFFVGESVAQKRNLYADGRLVCNVTSRSIGGISTSFTSESVGLDIEDDILVIYGTSPTIARAGTVSTVGTTVTGVGTEFTVQYTPGDYIKIDNQLREVVTVANNTQLTLDASLTSDAASGNNHYGVTPVYDIFKVLNISSDTTMTVDKFPRISTTQTVIASYQKVVRGVVDTYNPAANTLFVKQSTAANSNFKMVTGNQLVGGISDATANVVSINNLTSSFVECHVSTFVPPATSTSLRSVNTRTGLTELPYTIDNFYGVTNKLPYQSAIKSRSNEITGVTILPSFKFIQNISSGSPSLSPLVDMNPASAVIIGNEIDNYATTINRRANTASSSTQLQASNTSIEVGMGVLGLSIPPNTTVVGFNGANIVLSTASYTNLSNTEVIFTDNELVGLGINKNRYISKRLTLDDGLDAEDIKLYITAYKPAGTTIDVYAKILHNADPEAFETKTWTKLTQVTQNIFSDSLNDQDFREFEYTFPYSAPSVPLSGAGIPSSSSNTLNGTATQFNLELQVGDLVKIVQDSSGTSYDVRAVTAIANTTSLTLSSPPSFSAAGAIVEKLVQPKAAFKYNRNSNIVRYYNSTGGAFETYKTAAIKIVIKSPDTALVPILRDVRAVAVSV